MVVFFSQVRGSKNYVLFLETSKKCVKDYGNFDHCSKVNFVNSVVFQKVKEMVMQKKALRISS